MNRQVTVLMIGSSSPSFIQ